MRVALSLAVLIAGCGTADTPVERFTASPGGDTCDAAQYQHLIGQNAEAGKTLPDPKRMYRLGDPVTLDFNPARLNVKLDEAGSIAAIDCG